MPHLVTVTREAKTKLRREQATFKKREIIGSGFTDKTGTVYNFKGEDGQITESIEISDQLVFDLENPVDNYNWNVLKAFQYLNPDLLSHVILNDQEAENEKAVELSDRVFEVESYLRKNKEDEQLLAKIHRRVVGLVDGITPISIFRKLIDVAKSDPNKFYVRGELLTNAEEFEMMAIIDIAIERGIMILDGELIKMSDGKIYAKDRDYAAFLLQEDTDTRLYLQRAIEGRLDTTSAKYEPIIEDSEFVKLRNLVGEKPVEEKQDDTLGELTEADILEAIAKWGSSGLITREGHGAVTTYSLDTIPGRKFKKKELADFFKINPAAYRHLAKMAAA